MTDLKFKISTGLKNIIGKELITNDLIAIFELVKNAYDANAKQVRIIFQELLDPKWGRSKILIVDDGYGMSKADIESKFLFVGYSEKKPNAKYFNDKNYRDKIGSKRMYAGAKGVGRFSSDRLGKTLTLYTKKTDEQNIHKINIDWTKFEHDQREDFLQVNASYSSGKDLALPEHVSNLKHGTILEISGLHDSWDVEKLRKLKRYLQRLINPSDIRGEHDFKVVLEAKEFLAEDKTAIKRKEEWDAVNGAVENFLFERLGIKTTEIDTSIDEEGESIITKMNDKGTFVFEFKEKNEYASLKNIRIKLFYLNTSAKMTFTRTMGLAPVAYGSIFVYKNGIRVHPYGDEGDDWLGLERRRVQGYKRYLSTRELMGRIEISGHQPGFIEVSSRDGGLFKNEAHRELIDLFIKKALQRLEKYVIEGLDWDSEESQKTESEIKQDSVRLISKIVGQVKDPEKEIKFNKDLTSLVRQKETEKLPELVKNLNAIAEHIKDPKERKYLENQLQSVKKATTELKHELKQTKKISLFLDKAVSSDKDVLLKLNHTVKIATFSIESIIKEINKAIQDKQPINKIIPLLDELNLENQKIRVLSSYVSFANFNTKVENIEKDLVQFVAEYFENVKGRDAKSLRGLSVKCLNSKTPYMKKFNPLEVSIIFDNLVDNAKKAGASLAVIKFKAEKRALHIFFGDNGKGIKPHDSKFIFDRGFSTTDGSGIGLHHVKNLLNEMDGNIQFIGNGIEELGKGACFEITIR